MYPSSAPEVSESRLYLPETPTSPDELLQNSRDLFQISTLIRDDEVNIPQRILKKITRIIQKGLFIGGELTPLELLVWDILNIHQEVQQQINLHLVETEGRPLPSPQAIMDACVDYVLSQKYIKYQRWAKSIPDRPHVPNNPLPEHLAPFHNILQHMIRKQQRWNQAVGKSVRTDKSQTHAMHLYPVYWELIFQGKKTIEGRAYKPWSRHKWPAIRPGDIIEFTEEAMPGTQLLTDPRVMRRRIRGIAFGPLVVANHFFYYDGGEKFQPEPSLGQLGWGIDALFIINTARYYDIPGYRELIAEHGFIGLMLEPIDN